jgi:hypothetical protein
MIPLHPFHRIITASSTMVASFPFSRNDRRHSTMPLSLSYIRVSHFAVGVFESVEVIYLARPFIHRSPHRHHYTSTNIRVALMAAVILHTGPIFSPLPTTTATLVAMVTGIRNQRVLI